MALSLAATENIPFVETKKSILSLSSPFLLHQILDLTSVTSHTYYVYILIISLPRFLLPTDSLLLLTFPRHRILPVLNLILLLLKSLFASSLS